MCSFLFSFLSIYFDLGLVVLFLRATDIKYRKDSQGAASKIALSLSGCYVHGEAS